MPSQLPPRPPCSLVGSRDYGRHSKRRFHLICIRSSQQTAESILVVVGGGAAGVFAAIRAKEVAPCLRVLIIEKGTFLSKVRISGGGRCNVTNGHYVDRMGLAGHYPRGHKELRGSFFNMHGPLDTIAWFSEHGVELKTEDDGRVFPITNNSASIVDCLLREANKVGVTMQAGKVVTNATSVSEKFLLKIEKPTNNLIENIDADYLLIATGNSQQGYSIAAKLGHSIVAPVPSLFTFKIEDAQLAALSGVTFPKVKAKLKLEDIRQHMPQLTQACPSSLLTFRSGSGIRFGATCYLSVFIVSFENLDRTHAGHTLGTKWTSDSPIVCLGCS